MALFLLPQGIKAEEVLHRGLFVSTIQNPPVLTSRKEITELIAFAKQAQINTLFVQIYRANQAWFPSKVADSKPYRNCLKSVEEDPLGLLIRKAHQEGIQVHAWLNLLSLANNKDARILKEYGTEVLTKDQAVKKRIEDYKIDNQYFLEPGDPRVYRDLSRIVKEILRAYPELDGIQFDYIRYPDFHPIYGHTPINIKLFKKEKSQEVIDDSSNLWKQWKRDRVTQLLTKLVKIVRISRPRMQVSTTGCVSYVRAYEEAFQDWPGWVNSHLIDFVTIMNYPKEVVEFKKNIAEAKKRVDDFKKVNVAVGAYKLEDLPTVLMQEFQACEKEASGACVVFHYGSLSKTSVLRQYLKQEPFPTKDSTKAH